MYKLFDKLIFKKTFWVLDIVYLLIIKNQKKSNLCERMCVQVLTQYKINRQILDLNGLPPGSPYVSSHDNQMPLWFRWHCIIILTTLYKCTRWTISEAPPCFVQYKFFALTDFLFFALCLPVNLNITQLRIDHVLGNFRSSGLIKGFEEQNAKKNHKWVAWVLLGREYYVLCSLLHNILLNYRKCI